MSKPTRTTLFSIASFILGGMVVAGMGLNYLNTHQQEASTCCPLATPSENVADLEGEVPAIESDAVRKKAFQKKLTALLEAGEVVDPEMLKEQLCREFYFPGERAAVGATEKTSGEIYRDHKRSVVLLGYLYLCNNCDKKHFGCASGFVVSTNGIVATNYHVIDGDKRRALGVMTEDGEVYDVREVLAANEAHDVALIRIDATGLTPAAFAENEPVGSGVSVISHPNSRFYSLTQGIISRYAHKFVNGDPVLQMEITADFARGSSGAPVFNNRGGVVGMVKSTSWIYYTREKGVSGKLQMVVKNCVPSESILALFREGDGSD